MIPKLKIEADLTDSESNVTERAISPGMEAALNTPHPVLDHGFVRVVDYMGNDNAIVQAARVSYGKGTKQISQDRGLIYYLLRHKHTTPFEMCEIKFHIKLPIFIARQWIRHRTANVNEYSARYSILGKDYYIPAPEQIAPQSSINKQGRDGAMPETEIARIRKLLKDESEHAYETYQHLLNIDDEENPVDESRPGLSRELARMALPLNYYTEWYWKIDLHNLLHFLALRADNHAQYEIRAYAEVMLDIVKAWVPITYEAFMRYRRDGVNLSSEGLMVVKRLLKGEKVVREDTSLSKREWDELCLTLDIAS